MNACGETLGRREFAAWLAAFFAAGGLAGCGKPPAEKIVPYARNPEGLVPGKPQFYATAAPSPDGALGVLVRSDMGRPTKIEGNPRHPASLGATDAQTQAEILTLWDPDRSQTVLLKGTPSSGAAFQSALAAALEGPRARKGDGLRILTGNVFSPTLAGQLERLLQALPAARWHAFDPLAHDSARAGCRMAFGVDVEPIHHLQEADVVLSLDADLLCDRVRQSHDFAERRRMLGRMNRLYAVEPMPTVTGSAADHRWPLRASEVEAAAWELARALRLFPSEPSARFPWVPAVAKDLRRRTGLVAAGPQQPPVVHALAAAMNHALGSVGRAVVYADPPAFPAKEGLEPLVADMAAGRVEALVILGANPVETAPADLEFGRALSRVGFRVHLGLYADETARLCHWHVPETHFLESWSDARAYDGTVTIVQPLIAPLYGGRSVHEVAADLLGEPGRRAYDLVRDHWKKDRDAASFERFWQTSLHEGVVEGTAFAPRAVTPRLEAIRATPAPAADGIELAIRPDPTIADGRYANNAWLQELPKPVTKLTWDNAAMIAPAEAARKGLANGDEVEIRAGARSLRAPIWIVPGHADRAITLHLGYGRTHAGRVGSGRGFRAGALRTTGPIPAAVVERTGNRWELASTQLHHTMEGRDPVRRTTAAEFSVHRDAIRRPEDHDPAPSLYLEEEPTGNAWGMVIDLNTCTGCNACVTACQAENNIPVVGKDEVLRGREMHWIRVDTYQDGPVENPRRHHQPVPCMHCEKAPCEVVCPTFATAHSSDGLNQMVYNRCVGTRYCQNNCPYKVRRFNFFQYADVSSPAMRNLHNPDVTVRERGVMEKCTYCVQRIVRTRIEADKEQRPIREGEVRTACQQACPAGAIVFGDLSRRRSAVSRLRESPLHYELLAELRTQPRTTYLASVRNPNPEAEGA